MYFSRTFADFLKDTSWDFDFDYLTDNSLKVKKNEEGYILTLDVPGHDKDDINLEYADGKLSISSDKVKGREFSNTVSIGEKMEVEKISAEVDKGILTIFVPFKITKKVKINIK